MLFYNRFLAFAKMITHKLCTFVHSNNNGYQSNCSPVLPFFHLLGLAQVGSLFDQFRNNNVIHVSQPIVSEFLGPVLASLPGK